MSIVTLFQKLTNVNNPYHVGLDFVLDRISKPTQQKLVESIRSTDDKADRNVLKKELQCILFSGRFSKRHKDGLVEHSGLICLDFDSFEDEGIMGDFYNFAKEDSYTRALFMSPSGNGYKLVVKIPTKDHLGSFLALQEYYTSHGFGKYFDKSTKDVSRVCYNSYDPDLYRNSDSEVFEDISNDLVNIGNKKVSTIVISSPIETITKLIVWWDQNYGFVQGEKNNNLFILANAFNQYGIPESECESYFLANYYRPPCKDPSEISTLVKNAYKNVSEHNTKAFEDSNKVKEVERLSKKGLSSRDISDKMNIDIDIIDDVIDNIDNSVFWKKSSKGVVTTTMLGFKNFLESNGFYKYKSEETESFLFVRVLSNLIDNVTEVDIKDFVLDYLEGLEDKAVYEHFAKMTSHFNENMLNFLPNIKINLRLDKKKIGYVYFRNCAVRITPDGMEKIDYVDLEGAVWRSHVIDRDFEFNDNHENDFKKFVSNISKEGREDVVKASESALGYLMHNFNDRKNQRAIILNDSKQTGHAEEGGIGKGLFVQGIEQIRRTVIEDGKDFDEGGQFKYQRVRLDTQVFCFDDVPKKFNFKKLFSVITDGMTVEKKNKDSVKLKYSDSPKIVITTNYVIKGKGNSHARRKFELEFGEYYGSHRTPYDDFGCELFTEWDADHFRRFDNYMLSLIQKYMVTGLIAPISDTSDERRLAASTDPFFIIWMNEVVNTLDSLTSYSVLYSTYLTEVGISVSFKEFTMWVEDYCSYRGYKTFIKRLGGQLTIQVVKDRSQISGHLKEDKINKLL